MQPYLLDGVKLFWVFEKENIEPCEIFFCAMQSLCLLVLRCGVRWQSAEKSARCPISVDCDGFVYHYGMVFIEYVSELLVAVIVFCAIHIYIAFTR